MHQQPPQAPRLPKRVSRSDHLAIVRGWKRSLGVEVRLEEVALIFDVGFREQLILACVSLVPQSEWLKGCLVAVEGLRSVAC